MKKKFWKNKKVLITGHTGFKGGWLSLWLKTLEAKVFGISLKEEKESFFNFLELKKKINKNIYCNILDKKKFKNHLIKIEPEIIFHFAAQPLVLRSYLNPNETLSTNVTGLCNLLDICRELKSLKVIIIATSDKCYYPLRKKFVENDKLGGKDIYSASKACAEIITEAYKHSFFSKKNDPGIATVRAGNVIGGGDFAKNRIIPDLMNSFKNNKSCVIRNPNHIRPWQYVLEPLFGYILLAEKLYRNKKLFSSAWNFGPKKNNVNVSSIVKLMQLYINVKIKKYARRNKIYENKELSLSSKKSFEKLKWTPKLSLKKSIKFLSDWYLNCNNRKKILEISLNQIKKYSALQNFK